MSTEQVCTGMGKNAWQLAMKAATEATRMKTWCNKRGYVPKH